MLLLGCCSLIWLLFSSDFFYGDFHVVVTFVVNLLTKLVLQDGRAQHAPELAARLVFVLDMSRHIGLLLHVLVTNYAEPTLAPAAFAHHDIDVWKEQNSQTSSLSSLISFSESLRLCDRR